MNHGTLSVAAGLILAGMAALPAHAFVYENDNEMMAQGDFDGDGRLDVAVLDKPSGRFRVGYQKSPGQLTWAPVRKSEILKVTGFTVGRLLSDKRDALAFTASDANQINVVDATDLNKSAELIPFLPDSLGPSVVVAISIPGSEAAGYEDLAAVTVYNAPEPYHLDLMRNYGGGAESFFDFELPGEVRRGNRFLPGEGRKPLLAGILEVDKKEQFHLADVSSGEPQPAGMLAGLTSGFDYALAGPDASGTERLAFYVPGEKELSVYRYQPDTGDLQLQSVGKLTEDSSIMQVYTLGSGAATQLVVLFGEGEKAGVFKINPQGVPTVVQMIEARENEYWSGVAQLEDSFVLLARKQTMVYSSTFQIYSPGQTGFVAAVAGELSTIDETVLDIHASIVANLDAVAAVEMKNYTNTIPGTKVNYTMVALPGGEFIMGSPDSEPERDATEGPQHRVQISPFWIGKFEVTWDEYLLFMYPDEERKFKDEIATDGEVDRVSDAVTRPTKPYMEMSFGMGRYGYPAISMTQHAANKYCQWLSAKTGHFYRLPTEAEWEYACRAGTTTAYGFGDDVANLEDYAWFEDNSDWKYQKVGRKKPNDWGLHDMHGNVWEWCLDQYLDDYASFTEPVTTDPWVRATRPYPHVARGGSYDDMPTRLRSATRNGSSRAWKMQDPQLPKSYWWLSDAPWVGFRLVRPLEVPAPEQLDKYWTSGVERD